MDNPDYAIALQEFNAIAARQEDELVNLTVYQFTRLAKRLIECAEGHGYATGYRVGKQTAINALTGHLRNIIQ